MISPATLHVKRTDGENLDFIALVQLLDADLAVKNGEEHTYYAQFNKITGIRYAVVAYWDGKAVGCGAFKIFESNSVEIKRMFTLPEARSKGVAYTILSALEQWAAELSYEKCVLETGLKQPEAIALYGKSGYIRIPNYGQYAGIENSVCFEKTL